jgi:hypothetical protein
MSLTDYKAKYMDLKAKFMETVDLSWRLGYEQGLKDSEMQQAQAQQQVDAMAQNPQSGPEGSTEAAPTEGQEQPISQNPNGDDELGQHIEKLEGMLGKSEISPIEIQELKKTLNDIRSLQVSINLTKSMESAKGAKMSRPFQPLKLNEKLQVNLKESAKKALSMQEEIVNSIFQKWEKDESKATNDINSILKIEGLSKKE